MSTKQQQSGNGVTQQNPSSAKNSGSNKGSRESSDQSSMQQQPSLQSQEDAPETKPVTLEELFGLHASEDDEKTDNEDKPNDETPTELSEDTELEIDGEKLTLKAFKERVKEHKDFNLRVEEFERNRRASEAGVLQARNELTQLLSFLPKQALKPELLSKLRDMSSQHMQRERERTADVIPEWKNETVRKQELDGIAVFMRDFGFFPEDLHAIADHRVWKFVREMFLQDTRIKTALAKVREKLPEQKGLNSKGSAGAGKKPVNQQKSTKKAADPLKALFN